MEENIKDAESKEESEVLEETKEEAKDEVKENKDKPKTDKKDKHKEEIKKLNEEISKLKNENLKMKDEYLRARADLENTRRRLNEDALQTKKYASQHLVEELINPVDMLAKVCNMTTDSAEVNNFLIGFKMISKQLSDILEGDGLKEIEALNKDFDPTVHHAIASEYKEGVEPNKVLEVMQTGYKYKDRVLRPSMVKVSIAKEDVKDENTNDNENVN